MTSKNFQYGKYSYYAASVTDGKLIGEMLYRFDKTSDLHNNRLKIDYGHKFGRDQECETCSMSKRDYVFLKRKELCPQAESNYTYEEIIKKLNED